MDRHENLKKRIHKQKFERNISRKDGLLLQVHHTLPDATGNIRRSRFLHAAFSSCDEFLAVADHRGSIFIIDLANDLFWQLEKIVSVSVLAFHSFRKDELFIGHTGTQLSLINAGTGAHLGSLCGHNEVPIQISFNSDGNCGLSVSKSEGFIWDLRTLTQAHRLNLQPGMSITHAMFVPISDNILACFQDGAIHVWAFETFHCVKQIVPDSWKGDCIQSIAFTRNGRGMVIGGTSKQLVIFAVDDWTSQRTLVLPESVSSVRHLEFMPEAFDSGSNRIIAVLSDTGSLFFIDMSTGSLLTVKEQKSITTFTCSKSGKYIASTMESGVVKIFSSTKLLGVCASGGNPAMSEIVVTGAPCDKTPLLAPSVASLQAKKKSINKKKLSAIEEMTKVSLDFRKLKSILLEFWQYPDQYRSLIWKSILQLPGNRDPWESLAKRPLHPSAHGLSKTNPLQNKAALNCLQSVVSCLSYWAPVFGELVYLPRFIFPFVKVFHSDKFVCFEAVASIIVNWCQHWFEYLSFPPVNILGMIENVLSEHDTGLLSFFCKFGITSRNYAWSLLSSAFSEVLSSTEWLQFWDHVLSNPPWFLLFAVVAYNICCKASLKTCVSKEDFEFFFHHQNPINMKQFLKKSYDLMEKTSKANHPQQYLTDFKALSCGNYPVFSAYPKFIVNYQKEQRAAIRREEEKILKEQHDIISQSLAREDLRLRENQARVHTERLIEAERAARAALEVEENKLEEKRRQLISLQRDLRTQERDSIANTRVQIMEQQVKQRCAEVDHLHKELHRKTEQSAVNAQAINAEWQDHFNRLASKKQQLEERLNNPQLSHLAQDLANNIICEKDFSELRKQQQSFCTRVKEDLHLNASHQYTDRPRPDFEVRLAEIDGLKQRVEIALAQKVQQQQEMILEAEQSIQEAQKEAKLEQLSNEVEQLMERLTATVLKNDVYPRNDGISHVSDSRLHGGYAGDKQGDHFPSTRSSDLYDRERSAVTSAMELRKTLLQNIDRT